MKGQIVGVILFVMGIFIKPILWLISRFIPEDTTLYYHNCRQFKQPNCTCKTHGYNKFTSQAEYNDFKEQELVNFEFLGEIKPYNTKPKVQFLGFAYGAQHPEFGWIFSCKTCHTLWELSHPENAYRGYFKGIQLNKVDIQTFIK